MSEDRTKPNPNWVDAPYEVDLLIWVPKQSTRKKQIKARRRVFRKITEQFKQK